MMNKTFVACQVASILVFTLGALVFARRPSALTQLDVGDRGSDPSSGQELPAAPQVSDVRPVTPPPVGGERRQADPTSTAITARHESAPTSLETSQAQEPALAKPALAHPLPELQDSTPREVDADSAASPTQARTRLAGKIEIRMLAPPRAMSGDAFATWLRRNHADFVFVQAELHGDAERIDDVVMAGFDRRVRRPSAREFREWFDQNAPSRSRLWVRLDADADGFIGDWVRASIGSAPGWQAWLVIGQEATIQLTAKLLELAAADDLFAASLAFSADASGWSLEIREIDVRSHEEGRR